MRSSFVFVFVLRVRQGALRSRSAKYFEMHRLPCLPFPPAARPVKPPSSRARPVTGRRGLASSVCAMASVFVTGSSDGIGQETARQLVAGGHRVVLHARDDARAKDATDAVPEASGI